MKIFDTHIHWNSETGIKKIENILTENKFFIFNNVGTSLVDSKIAVEQAQRHENIFCTIGIHPLDIDSHDQKTTFDELKTMVEKNEKVIAIGETGLDFYRATKCDNFDNQKQWLLKHGEFAKKFKKPLVLHIRDAHKEAIEILKNELIWYGVIHAFDGSLEDLDEYLKLDNWYISISPLVKRKFDKFQEIIKRTPLNKLLIETDFPWLTNQPHIIEEFLKIISEEKKLNLTQVKEQILKNTEKLFNLKLI